MSVTSIRTPAGRSLVGRASYDYRPATHSPLAQIRDLPENQEPLDDLVGQGLATSAPTRAAHGSIDRNGTFDFDKIVKAGIVSKRRRRTKSWKVARLVLRPNVLSIYNDQEETQLKHRILLADITTVTIRKEQIGKKREGLFGVFTPLRNYHLRAESDEEASAWADVIRKQAHLDDSPFQHNIDLAGNRSFDRTSPHQLEPSNRFQSLSATALDGEGQRPVQVPRGLESQSMSFPPVSSSYEQYWSGPGSYSSHSDSNPVARYRAPSTVSSLGSTPPSSLPAARSPGGVESYSFYKLQIPTSDKERVIWQGYLHRRTSQRGIRSWKKHWVVLRPQNLALYRDEEEYAALLIIPLSNVLDVVETECMSKKWTSCMQVITDDKVHRFCAANEEDLSIWIGRIKSALLRRQEARL